MLQIRGDRNDVVFEQPLLLSRVAAVGHQRVARALEAARKVAHEGFGSTAAVQPGVGDEHSHEETEQPACAAAAAR
jgi:hypothetical protein